VRPVRQDLYGPATLFPYFSQRGNFYDSGICRIVLCGLAVGVAAFVIYRENSPRSPVQATFYQDLAQADAVVDPAAAQSMISG
jgi:hypothetical protein